MTETLKLYDEDAYRQEFSATVLSCEEGKDGYALILDQTVFFPEEGGQSADTGYLCAEGSTEQVQVKDVQIRDNVITHILEAPLAVGTKVVGHIDFAARYDKMQQHSGEHIFSGTVHRLFGYDNVGFRLSDHIVTMDFNGPLSPEQVAEVEEAVNRVIWENVPIVCRYVPKEELDRLEYRSKKELAGPVRLVQIASYDLCACCAPHVYTTGEIGLLKVTSLQNYKGGVRISICCGNRALQDYREKQESVTAVSNLLSAKPEEIGDAVSRLLEENGAWKQRYNVLMGKMLSDQIDSMDPAPENAILFEETFDPVVTRNAVNRMTERFSGYSALFCGSEEEGYRFIIGSKAKDCREIAAGIKELGGKGGGSAEMIQGSIHCERARLEQLFA
ncbi:MAG: alanyl-tRNA editing protein [Lachnospiraceae bacterium]|nr:alanyl-tRNA editing protein [Lachnospiraceae bacterium]